jgi:hypothetical protein
MYFDIETNQSGSFEGNDNWKEHQPNLLICQHVCMKCENIKEKDYKCKECGEREHIFDAFQENSQDVDEDDRK